MQSRKVFAFLFGFFLLLPIFAAAQPEEISLEKIIREGYFRPSGITRGRSMQDGLRYTLISNRTDLNVHMYETGEFVETLFSTTGLLTDDQDRPLAIGSYQFGPDEKYLLIGVRQQQIYRRSSKAQHYLYSIADKTIEPLSEGTYQQIPEFSPDGKKVAFVRDNNLFIKEIAGGKEWAVTTDGIYNEIINGTTDWVYEEEFGFVKGFYWSPDSRRIAYYRFDETHVKEFVMMLYGSLYPREYRFKYPKAGEQNAHVNIYVYDLESANSRLMDTGEEKDQYIPRIGWTSNPEKLAIQVLNRHQNKLNILLGDALSGETDLLYTETNKYYIDITDDLTFLADGRHFIISSEKSGFNHLYLYDMRGREVRALTSGNWDVQRFLGVDESKGLVYYLAREESPMTNHLYSVRLNGRGKTRLSRGHGTHNPAFSNGFRFFINEFSTFSMPPIFSLHKADGGLIKVLEDNSSLNVKLRDHGFVEPEWFSFITSDGVSLNGWMLKPHDFDPGKKYPVFMYVYGGPGSQTVIERYNASNGPWFQMLAQMGFLVVSVDNRGTGGRGEEFKKMTYMQLGKYETIDQIEAAKYLGTLGFVDSSRIGIYGWSYGGYMNSLCISLGADVFAAAIAGAPVTSWRYYDTIYTERYMRTPQENPSGYDDNSPITHAGAIRGAYLLIHGSADDNVHYQNTIEMADALIKAGVQFDLMIYPNHNHGISTPNARLHMYRMMNDFLLKNLMNN